MSKLDKKGGGGSVVFGTPVPGLRDLIVIYLFYFHLLYDFIVQYILVCLVTILSHPFRVVIPFRDSNP